MSRSVSVIGTKGKHRVELPSFIYVFIFKLLHHLASSTLFWSLLWNLKPHWLLLLFWLRIVSSRCLRPMTSPREETTKSPFGPAKRFECWSPTTNGGTPSGAWWRPEVGRGATCHPATSQYCPWGPCQRAHISPTARREERKEGQWNSL